MRLSCKSGIRTTWERKTENGQLAVKVLDKYMQDFQQRNPTLRVFSAYLHMDEATPHLHIDLYRIRQEASGDLIQEFL